MYTVTLTLLHDNVTRQPNQHRQTFYTFNSFVLNEVINNKILKKHFNYFYKS